MKLFIDIPKLFRARIMCAYYAVAKGRVPGIYNTWEDCKQQVHQVPNAVFKKFVTIEQAQQFIKERSSSSSLPLGSSASNGQKNSNSIVSRLPGETFRLGNKQSKITKFVKVPQTISKRALSTTDRNDPSPTSKRCKVDSNITESKNNDGKQDIEKFDVDTEGYVNVFTDGACSTNGSVNAKAGIGVWFGDNHPLNVSRPVVGRATNNMAEIQAVTIAAMQAKKAGIKKLRINTDSQFLINCITKWMTGWKRNGWRTTSGKPVINKTELLEMEAALSSLEISWNHVRGHKGIYGNEMADELARKGCSANVTD